QIVTSRRMQHCAQGTGRCIAILDWCHVVLCAATVPGKSSRCRRLARADQENFSMDFGSAITISFEAGRTKHSGTECVRKRTKASALFIPGTNMTVAGKRAGDRRIQRTRNTLREALVSLIREKPYDAIAVTEILERANVGRSTFYMHFRNK